MITEFWITARVGPENSRSKPRSMVILATSDTSTAGNATIANNTGTGGGGQTMFGTVGGTDTSNAGTAQITNNNLGTTSFLAATSVRYVLRKELMQDIRGLRRDLRSIELNTAPASQAAPPATSPADSLAPRS